MFLQKENLAADNLIAGNGAAIRAENVSLKGGMEIARGMVLCGSSDVYEPVKVLADKSKPLVIASEDQTVADGGEVGTVYTSGEFNLAEMSTGASDLKVTALKEDLRKVNILIDETI